MEVPGLHTGHDIFRDLTVYLTAQLNADAETRSLAASIAAAWDDLKAVGENHRAMEDSMVMALAMRDRVDGRVDDFVRAQFRAAQGVYGTKGRKLNALYPGGLSKIVYGPIPEQPGKMRVLAARLGEDENTTLAASAELMRQNAATLDEVVESFDVSVEMVASAWAQVLRARSEWIRRYEQVFGELVTLVGKKKASSYFKKVSKKRKKKPTA